MEDNGLKSPAPGVQLLFLHIADVELCRYTHSIFFGNVNVYIYDIIK